MRRFSVCVFSISMFFCVSPLLAPRSIAPAFAGEARTAGPATFTTIAAIPAQAAKDFTVSLRPGTDAAAARTVAAYFAGFGLTTTVTPEHDIIFVRGTYAQAAEAAHTSFVRVRVRKATFTHALTPEAYPVAIARSIVATTMEEGPSAVPAGVTTLAPPNGYAPADIAAYYDIAPLYRAGLSGAGQRVAVLACATVVPADIRAFATQFGLPTATLTVTPVDGGTTVTALEPTGDVERVLGTAPKTHVYLYVVPDDCSFGHLADGFARIAADTQTLHFAAVTHSYGATEDDYAYYGAQTQLAAEHQYLQLLHQRDTPVFTVSGDWGASFGSSDQALYDGELTVWYPASDPDVIAVGGTEAVAISATDPMRLEELAWGDGGGGVSADFLIPSWQKGTPGLASSVYRNVPDVALASSGGEAYAAVWTPEGGSQGEYWFYGTSFAGPTWAGLIALVEQHRVTAKKPLLSNLVASLYSLRSSAGFVDIVAGCNGYYCAKPGYDNVTGLGVFDAGKLESELFTQP